MSQFEVVVTMLADPATGEHAKERIEVTEPTSCSMNNAGTIYTIESVGEILHINMAGVLSVLRRDL